MPVHCSTQALGSSALACRRTIISQSSYSLPNSDHVPQTAVSIDSIDITEEVFNTLSSLDTHKTTGIDGISPAILKHCAIVLTKPLHYLFSQIIRQCSLPDEWKIHFITPIFKSGDKSSVSNYRPISLLRMYHIQSTRTINLQ